MLNALISERIHKIKNFTTVKRYQNFRKCLTLNSRLQYKQGRKGREKVIHVLFVMNYLLEIILDYIQI